jgi:hypothetical protein
MSLLDSAREFNSREDAARREEEHRVRRRQLFKEDKEIWFRELFRSMVNLSDQFNSITQNDARHLKVEMDDGATDRIKIALLKRLGDVSKGKKCKVFPAMEEIRITCSYESSRGTEERHFEVFPSHETGIRVCISKERSRTVWPDEDGRKVTGDLFTDARTVTEKHLEKIGVDEFANYILDSFVKF